MSSPSSLAWTQALITAPLCHVSFASTYSRRSGGMSGKYSRRPPRRSGQAGTGAGEAGTCTLYSLSDASAGPANTTPQSRDSVFWWVQALYLSLLISTHVFCGENSTGRWWCRTAARERPRPVAGWLHHGHQKRQCACFSTPVLLHVQVRCNLGGRVSGSSIGSCRYTHITRDSPPGAD